VKHHSLDIDRLVASVAVDRWLPVIFRSLAFGIGALHTVVAIRHQSMNEDGINYLDIGTAYMAGYWHMALNGIWSPLYAWILAAALRLTRPSIWWEFPVVQITNLVIFVVALLCFEFFWRCLTRSYYHRNESAGPITRLPAPLWNILGYSLFIWSSLNLIEVWAVTPDMTVAALVYLAAGLLLKSQQHGSARSSLALLGVVLGFGYLAKAAMFPLGVVCVLLAAAIKAERERPAWRMALAAAPFVIVSGPLLVALSLGSGHLTFGDVGRFTYLKHVNQLLYPHWDESITRVAGRPEHAPRRAFENPDVYEFAVPIGGSYPLAYDPGFWTQGLSPRVDARQQLRAFLSNARFYFNLFVREQGGFAAILLLLGALAFRTGRIGFAPKGISAEAALVVWAVCAFGLYAVVFVTPRYIAPFVVIFWAGLLSSLTFPDSLPSRRLVTAAGILLSLFVWVNIGAFNLEGLSGALNFPIGVPTDPGGESQPGQFSNGQSGNSPEIAIGLHKLGVNEGARVGFIGYSFTAFWARLARLRIVAEIPPKHAEMFWRADPDTQSQVLGVFADAGATAVVAKPVARTLLPSGWQRIGETDYVVHFLR